MGDLAVAIGLVLVIEGLMLAATPGAVRRAMAAIEELSDYQMRITGLIGAIVGVLIVWLIRG